MTGSPPSPTVWYVYGVVPAAMELTRAPAGLDDVPLEREADGDVAALLTAHDVSSYGPEPLERSAADLEWLGPRAVAHDRVLTWASDRGPVVPFPMWAMFSSRTAVSAMLGARRAQLAAALARAATGREYALRVHVVDAELKAHLAQLSPAIADRERSLTAAAPGQRYLLQRKLEGERAAEAKVVARRVGRELYEELAALAAGAVALPILTRDTVSGAPRPDPMVLNAAFLVGSETYGAFQEALSARIARHRDHGFRFDFTGPWPPYHFVDDATRDDARQAEHA